MSKIITLRNSDKLILVSEDDYLQFCVEKWHIGGWGYAFRTTSTRGKRLSIILHIEIAKRMGLDTNRLIDHVDQNKLNCQRENLRIATKSQNALNSKHYKNNTSGYKGVYYDTRKNKWAVQIQLGGRHKHMGYFDHVYEAATAYNAAAIKYHGEFAVLNDI